jgi:2-polyprenyl-3-methyl-5-hydroxy-6-metoxy-1,4-benzoquinol methylase
VSETPVVFPDQADFLKCYRGRQTALHHVAYMRMGKVLLALHLCEQAGISLENKSIFDYGFGAGTFFRYCPPSSRLFGVEIDPENVAAVRAMLERRGMRNVDLRTIDIEHWSEHPLLEQTYDIIFCSHVLEHLPDPILFLNRIRQCMSPSGVFIGLVPINERKMDPHHVQRIDRSKIDDWAHAAGLQTRTYLQADPWLYWVQPVFASNSGAMHLLAQAISLGLGFPAALLGPQKWLQISQLFAGLTRSRATQAAFVLTRTGVTPNEIARAR